jgi:hypothetical protein
MRLATSVSLAPRIIAIFATEIKPKNLGCANQGHIMSIQNFEEHLLPRPVAALPEFANAQSRRTLAEKINAAFGLSSSAATAIANAVVNPSAVRKAIGDPEDPEVERIAVPGGTLYGIRTSVWARRVMPDPRNPRTLPSRRHPFAVDPGTAGEDSKYRPIPEPRAADPEKPYAAELQVEIENRHHITWASQLAAAYVLAENDWRDSIAAQGVMESVWVVPTRYVPQDGTDAVTALTTAEGSSRITAVHSHLGIRSADVPYDSNEAGFRAHIRRLNGALETGPSGPDLVALRCEQVPALILVGFAPHAASDTGFPTAVKSLVALRHVDPPKPWGEGPENESLADEVLDEMYRRNLISDVERDYYAGACTKAEAQAARLPSDPAMRASKIIRLLTSEKREHIEAIRVAVTSQSTRKRVSMKLTNDLATALILRAVAEEPAKTDQVRRYMRHAFGKSVHGETWENTARSTDQLVKDAQTELRASIAAGASAAPGGASVELAVRAAYALLVSGRLNADRGSSNNAQPDRRTPGEVLEAMRRSQQGIYQLGQALSDFASDTPIRAVEEDGSTKMNKDGTDAMVNDIFLREEFPPAGKKRAHRPGNTPQDHYQNRLGAFTVAMEELRKAFVELSSVSGDDGRPLVESQGVDHRDCATWRDSLAEIDEELVIWGRTFRRAYGNGEVASARRASDIERDDVTEDWDTEEGDEAGTRMT